MRPAACLAKRRKTFNQGLRHALTAGGRAHEKIIQRAAAPREDNFRQVEEMREAERLITAEGSQNFCARVSGDQLQHFRRRSGRSTGKMRRHLCAIGSKQRQQQVMVRCRQQARGEGRHIVGPKST